MNQKKNIISSIVLQIITMLSGFVLPRLIINTFGSEINGLISSVTQFLSFISLLEGGLGAVVLAELYKPIEDRDDNRIRDVLSECQNFFSKLAVAFSVYTIILAIVYPLFSETSYSFSFISSLVLILSVTTLIRYLFSVTSRLYLQADQRIYIVNNVSSAISLMNLFLVIIVIKIFPEIHVVKLIADILFIIQPIVFNRFIAKEYRVKIRIRSQKKNILKNRWSGFAQNLAHFINMNTDIAILTAFVGLKEVSVYSVYVLAINALRTFITLISDSYQSVLGKYYAQGNMKLLKEKFEKYEIINWGISLIAYSTCLLMINPFVELYTLGISDVNYYQPLFAVIMVVANLIYCVRLPYHFLVLATGRFKETNFGAIMEAILNIGISMFFVFKFGMVGVAIGTLIALLYRMVYYMWFLRANILHRSMLQYLPIICIAFLVMGINVVVYCNPIFTVRNIREFVIYGFLTMCTETIIVFCGLYVYSKVNWLLKNRKSGVN